MNLSKSWVMSLFTSLGNRITRLETSGSGSGFPEASILRAFQAADAAYSNDATLNNTNLSVAVASGGVYEVRAVLHVNAQEGGYKTGFGGTATATNFIADLIGHDKNDPTTNLSNRMTSLGDTLGDTIAAERVIKINGTIEVNAGGTFIITVSQNASHANATTLLRNSLLVLTKLN